MRSCLAFIIVVVAAGRRQCCTFLHQGSEIKWEMTLKKNGKARRDLVVVVIRQSGMLDPDIELDASFGSICYQ